MRGAPLDLWRTTNASTPIAAIVSIVSRRLSPLLRLDCDTANVIVSADRRLAAVSKLSRVRVESSKKDRKSTRLNSRHSGASRMPSSACKKKNNRIKGETKLPTNTSQQERNEGSTP